MARPKTDEKKKLAKVVLFRVTDGEMNQLETASEACGQRAKVIERQRQLAVGRQAGIVAPDLGIDQLEPGILGQHGLGQRCADVGQLLGRTRNGLGRIRDGEHGCGGGCRRCATGGSNCFLIARKLAVH